MREGEPDFTDIDQDDENDEITLLRSIYRTLKLLKTNIDNAEAAVKKGNPDAIHHLAIATQNAASALEEITKVGQSKAHLED